MEFKQILKERYATKKFNGKKVDNDKIEQIKEMIKLSPSAINLQPWKIKIIEDDSLKEKLYAASIDQIQITTCSHLLVFCANTDFKAHADKFMDMISNFGVPEENMEFLKSILNRYLNTADLCEAQKNVFIAATTALYAAKSLGIDSCPIQGFDPKAFSEILELPDNLIPTIIVPLGYPADNPMPKARFPDEDIFF